MSSVKLNTTGGSGGSVALKGPASTTSNADVELTLPVDDGTANQYLKTDGSGALSWSTVSSGAALTGSTDNTICTVTGANAIQGEANLTFDGSKLHTKSGDSGQGSPVVWADDLVVEGSGDSGITILSGNTADASLCFGDDGDADIGRVVYNHNSNFMGFDVSAASRMKVKGDGDVEIVDGDLKIGTAGHGIDFSAVSHSGGMTSELLDSYEEGTWTPADGGGIVPFANQDGTYVKVGNMVMASFRLICTTNVTSSASAYIVGLPFTSKNSATPGGMAISYTNSTDDFRTAHVNQNTNHCNFYKHTGANMTKAQMWDGASVSKQLSGTLCYLTD